MALIRQASAERIIKDAIVLDLGDLQRQGAAVIARARDQADAIVQEARAERDRIIDGAAERGRADGYERGLNQGRAKGAEEGKAEALAARQTELTRLIEAWAAALREFAERRDHMVQSCERDVIALACIIAQKVVKRSILADPALVVEQIREVLATVVRPTELSVAIHPEDRPLVESALAGLIASFPVVRSVALVDDPALSRGSCVARTRDPADSGLSGSGGLGGEIDASVDAQLDRIIDVLLPISHPRADSSKDSPPRP